MIPMRFAQILSVILVCATPRLASAQDAADPEQQASALVEEAAALGRKGQLAEAIATFKRAEALHPRAIHVCNIGLAYVRLNRWPQAQFFLSACRERWSQEQTSPIDEWVNKRLREAIGKLSAGDFAPITVKSSPAGAAIESSSFLPDETFRGPRIVWLPTGKTELKASLSGYLQDTRSIIVEKGVAQEIAFVLTPEPIEEPTPNGDDTKVGSEHDGKGQKGDAEVAELDTPTESSSQGTTSSLVSSPMPPPRSTSPVWPWIATATGVALIGAGAFVHNSALEAKHEAERYPVGDDFDTWNDRFSTRRTATLALYGLGAGALGTGLYFLLHADTSEGAKSWVQLRSTGHDTRVSVHWTWY